MPVSPLDCSMANRSAKPVRPTVAIVVNTGATVHQPLDWHAVMQL
jgi:hypothetical protein